MASKKTAVPLKSVDGVLKAMLVLSRTVDHVLEAAAVEDAVDEKYSASKVQILRLLGQRGSQTATQVARFLSVSKPAVSQIVNTMVRGRLVVRRPAKKDRREVGLELTKKGRDAYAAIRQRQRHFVRNTLRQVAGHNPDQWAELLRELSGALARADSSFKQHCMQCGAHADGSCVLSGGDAHCSFLRNVPPASAN